MTGARLFLVLSALAGLAPAQQVLLRIDGTTNNEWLGLPGIVPIGDADGDGVEDFVSGSSRMPLPLGPYARAYSGATGGVLWTRSLQVLNTAYAFAIRGGGDVDGDGVGDVLVGEPNFVDPSNNVVGATHVVSGASGSLIRTHVGLGGGRLYRTPGGIVGDTDGDGFDDYLISDHQYSGWFGWAYLHSGATGQILHVLSTVATDREYWAAALGDVDLDGFDDILISEGGCNGYAACLGFLAAYSGRTGQLLYRVQGDNNLQGLGISGERCGGEDLNSDGITDFIGVGDLYANASTQRGLLRAYSGTDGSVLWSRIGATSNAQLGWSSGVGDDWDRDGRADVVAFYGVVGPTGTRIGVFSGFDGSPIAAFPNPPAASHGGNLVTMADITDDGMREILTRAQFLTLFPVFLQDNGSILAMRVASGPAAYRHHHGRACSASNGHLPHSVLTADPRLGRTARVRLRGTVGGSIGGLMIGVPIASGISMSPFGATGCTLHVDPVWFSAVLSTDMDGLAGISVPVPPAMALAGLVLEAQWFVSDQAANSAGLILSTGIRLMLGT